MAATHRRGPQTRHKGGDGHDLQPLGLKPPLDERHALARLVQPPRGRQPHELPPLDGA